MGEMFWKKKVEQALDTLALGGMVNATIYAPSINVALAYPDGVIWLKDKGIEFEPSVYGLFTEAEIEALLYLFRMVKYERFNYTLRDWKDKKQKANENKNCIRSLEQIQEEVNNLYSRIEEMLKKEKAK